jgi:hypothetical protein
LILPSRTQPRIADSDTRNACASSRVVIKSDTYAP